MRSRILVPTLRVGTPVLPLRGLTRCCVLLLAVAARSLAAADWPWPAERDLFDLSDGFTQQIIAEGITGATAMALLPDGRILVCEQTGDLRMARKDGRLAADSVLTLTVDSYWERGLIGITLDPRFSENGYIYLCYVAPQPYPHHHVSRFTLVGDRIDPASEKLLWQGDDQTKLGGTKPAGHQGGAVRFGLDGKLYIALGEQTAGEPSQRLDTFQGKLLRINPDGSIPDDNPFVGQAKGKYRAIYARGLRNPFMIAVHPTSGRIFLNDVGGSRWEEINEAAPGANFGWPVKEGPLPAGVEAGEFQPPIYAYAEAAKQSITGGTFYAPPQPMFPKEYHGKYLFADYMLGWIRWLDPQVAGTLRVPSPEDGTHIANGTPTHYEGTPVPTTFAAGLPGPVDLQVAADGSLYVLCRNVWVKDDKFQSKTGSLHRIAYTGAGATAGRITKQPQQTIVAPGEVARFTIAATGEQLDYRWQRNGKWLNHADGPALTLPLVEERDNDAVFHCVIRSSAGYVRSQAARLRVTKLHNPVAASQTGSGLRYELHAGRWSHLPPFDRTSLVSDGVAERINVSIAAREHDFGLSYRGLLKVEHQGTYTFHVASSGAAKLYVAGQDVAAVGTTAGPREAAGVIGLRPGHHSLRLDFAQAEGLPNLRLEMQGPERERGELAVSQLWHATSGPPDVQPPQPLAPTVYVPLQPEYLPLRLSETGIFRSLADLSVNPGMIGYDVKAPLWSDGAAKRRWLIVPAGRQIEWSKEEAWHFPPGTVFVKHFELGDESRSAHRPRRLETRLLVVDRDGAGYGATYKWRDDESDADLLTDGLEERITKASSDSFPHEINWSYPSRQQCLICHTSQSGFVLGVSTRQLNRDNQLAMLSRLHLLSPEPLPKDLDQLPRLASITDESAPLAKRARSYLDSNCSQCHRPDGVRSEFDARFSTPLTKQNLLDGKLVAADLGVPNAKVVVPGNPERSMILLRMQRREDVFNMPPLASHVADKQAVDVFRRWIAELPTAKPK